MSSARVDQWLWSVRVFKTRAAAKTACEAGRVKVNGEPAKAARKVSEGDTVTVRQRGETRVLEVVRPILKRVGAAIAAECMIDHTPVQEPSADVPTVDGEPFTPLVGSRERGAGRPTKRERRQMDRFRNR